MTADECCSKRGFVTFRLAHLSDLHTGPIPPFRAADVLNKRLTGYLNWRAGRRDIHNMDMLAALTADIRAARPDHIAATGDLVNIGLPQEFDAGLRQVQALGAPADVSLIPGNHDAYVTGSLDAMIQRCGAYMSGDGAAAPAFPFLRVRGGAALIGVNTGVPTLPFLATGRVDRAQLAALGRMLDETRAQNFTRIVMIHHPPHFSGSRWGRRLTNALEVEALLKRHGAELVIHGHNHRHSIAWLNGPLKKIPVIGVASASALPGSPHHRAEWHLYEIDGAGADIRIRITVRGRTADGSFGLISETALAPAA